MKRYWILIMAGIASACNQPSQQSDRQADTLHPAAVETIPVPDPTTLIMPGKRIGITVIQANADSLIKIIGKPDFSDAAMGTYLNTWYARHTDGIYQTSIFSQRNMGGPVEAITHVKSVYVTSPAFRTSNGLGPGTPMATIQNLYTLRNTGTFVKDKDSLQVYEDLASGISFEAGKDGVCKGVLVYAPQDSGAARRSVHSDWMFVAGK
ncbi:hypothetical protein [Chitinophaga sp. sic0106]|uniref:hypothetical protein n=1 Tax=Chitinophaga sp. sic0106 TaxID=2854785 RepID=UPI001C453EB5|nr:hypothetical protein [Chitinophaga sp. sic0106]MBV7533771.1 hypothetical protein [Chitinophaga sp. sic0106]